MISRRTYREDLRARGCVGGESGDQEGDWCVEGGIATSVAETRRMKEVVRADDVRSPPSPTSSAAACLSRLILPVQARHNPLRTVKTASDEHGHVNPLRRITPMDARIRELRSPTLR